MRPFMLIALVALLSACAEPTSEEADVTADVANTEAVSDERIVSVTALQLAPTNFNHYFTVQGIVEADQNAQIFPEAPARITSIKVQEGDQVSKGDVLMTLDSRIVDNQIDELKLRLDLAETVYKKQEELWSQEIGSELQYLQAKNNYESLEQNLEAVQAQKSLYVIKAPFSGVVDEITPKEGEMANPAMPVIRLINMKDVYIKSDVTERYLSKIKAGDMVEVTFPSLGIKKETKIYRLGNYINPANRTFKIKLNLDNADMQLKPNLLGELKIRDYYSDSTAVIPTSLVQMTPSGDQFVYAIEKGKAKKVAIITGMSYDGMIEVTEGLSGSEKLIDKGARSVKEGDKLDIQS